MKKRKAKVKMWHTGIIIDGRLDARWLWHLTSSYNGKIICAGEPNGYSSRAKARDGYKAAQKAFAAGVEEVK